MSTRTAVPEPSATCRAPEVALRFSPDGGVHPCCVNNRYSLGNAGTDDIRSIWTGAPLNRLRQALSDGDYQLGCRDCEIDHRLGERVHTHAAEYDRFDEPEVRRAWPARVEFALSNTCNLQCVHCNGELSSAIRAQREGRPPLVSAYGDAFFAELRDWLPHVEVAVFIGGEPFLSRECRRVWDLLLELDLHPEVHVTTNATVWDERVEHYVRELRMNVAVSIDGASAGTNEAIRVGSDHREVLANRDRLLALTRSYGGGFCLNHCFLRENWHELADFLLEADRLDVGVHVIPVHYPHERSVFSLPSDEVQRISAAMRRSAAASRLARNRPTWDAIVAHVRAYSAGLAVSTPVVIVPTKDRPPKPAVIEAVEAELAAWSGQAPLVLRYADGTIDALRTPDWAAGLGLEGFVGGPVEAFETAMAQRFGQRHEVEVVPRDDWVTWMTYTHRLEGGAVELRTAVIRHWGVITATRAAVLPAGPPLASGPS